MFCVSKNVLVRVSQERDEGKVGQGVLEKEKETQTKCTLDRKREEKKKNKTEEDRL